MHTYVSRLKDIELKTLIATYDNLLDLKPRMPDTNFKMINLLAEDMAIDKVPTNFNQNHVDRLKAHIVKLRDFSEGVLVRSGLSRVWRNPMCDPVLRHFDNTVMSIYDFLCMPSLDKAMVQEEPHGLDTSILGSVADRTISPTSAGTAISRASLEEIAVTRPNRKVVIKIDHTAKRKASTRPKISTNAAKKTRSSKKGSGRDRSEFAMKDIRNLNNVSQGERINIILLRTFDPSLGLDVIYPPILLPDKEVKAHAKLSGGVRRATRASFHVSHAPNTQPLDADAGTEEISSDGNVDPYYEARVSNTAGDVLERDILPFVLGPYYIPYPYDEGSGSESPPYTRDDWEEIHGVNLGLRKKEVYKDPKVCRSPSDRFPTPVETYRLRELSLVELSNRLSVITV
ncbi:hypothetical protein Tco_1038412 [Tanacetum coccineum]